MRSDRTWVDAKPWHQPIHPSSYPFPPAYLGLGRGGNTLSSYQTSLCNISSDFILLTYYSLCAISLISVALLCKQIGKQKMKPVSQPLLLNANSTTLFNKDYCCSAETVMCAFVTKNGCLLPLSVYTVSLQPITHSSAH